MGGSFTSLTRRIERSTRVLVGHFETNLQSRSHAANENAVGLIVYIAQGDFRPHRPLSTERYSVKQSDNLWCEKHRNLDLLFL